MDLFISSGALDSLEDTEKDSEKVARNMAAEMPATEATNGHSLNAGSDGETNVAFDEENKGANNGEVIEMSRPRVAFEVGSFWSCCYTYVCAFEGVLFIHL